MRPEHSIYLLFACYLLILLIAYLFSNKHYQAASLHPSEFQVRGVRGMRSMRFMYDDFTDI